MREGRPEVGDIAPEFIVQDDHGRDIALQGLLGRSILVIFSSPSIQNAVIAHQLLTLNDKIPSYIGQHDLRIWHITRDSSALLHDFATRYSMPNLKLLSDAKYHQFGNAYGVEIEDMNELARSAVVIDRREKILYRQLVNEFEHDPDYYRAFDAALGSYAK